MLSSYPHYSTASRAWSSTSPKSIDCKVFHLRFLRIISVRDVKRNTAIRKTAKQQRLSMVLLECRLCILGHQSWMDGHRLPKQLLVCAPVGGSRMCAVGRQKYRWNNLVTRDLKRCGLLEDWCELAELRDVWRSGIRRHAEVLNAEAEQEKKERKDERKRIRASRQAEVESALCCDHPGCSFAAVNKTGLTNHKCQKHTLTQAAVCAFAGSHSKSKSHNHQRSCRSRPQTT